MARVVALVPDLLFGSQVQGMLRAGGHDVELVSSAGSLQDRLAPGAGEPAEVLVVDLTNGDLDGPGVVKALAADGALEHVRTLGFYSHVETRARESAEEAGFDLVVPRSRMAREGATLVLGLAAGEG
jgi:hypothetical protein